MKWIFPVLLVHVMASAAEPPWPRTGTSTDTLVTRFSPPPGFTRVEPNADSFAAWVRTLPLLPDGSQVRLHSGALKRNQLAQAAVFDIDVGVQDLQQCADATIRLRAEYLWSLRAKDTICFRAEAGEELPYSRWQRGERPRVRGKNLLWEPATKASDTYADFRRYLDVVFSWASTRSLARGLAPVPDPTLIEPGDVFIKSGSPGHAVIVVDVAANPTGERVFLLAQSYMPAQQIHILKNPQSTTSAWYPAMKDGELMTPEWRFAYGDARRFPAGVCP